MIYGVAEQKTDLLPSYVPGSEVKLSDPTTLTTYFVT